MKRRDFLVAAAVAPLAPAAVAAAAEPTFEWTEVSRVHTVLTTGAHPGALWDGIKQHFGPGGE